MTGTSAYVLVSWVSNLHELDLKKIAKDLKDTRKKFAAILEKYNGKVVFGVAGEHADW